MNDQQNPPVNDEAPASPVKSAISPYQGYILLAGGVGAILWGLGAALGSAWDFWSWKAGLGGIRNSFFLALASLLLGMLLLWRNRRRGATGRYVFHGAGMGAALLYSAYIISFVVKATSVPAIHDISTDLADPPAFAALSLRADNLDNVPGDDDPDMKGLNPQQRWARLHQKAYSDIRSVRLAGDMPVIIGKAERLAKARGWDIAVADPVEGRLEATDTSRFFRFRDDIVIRVRAAESGEGSIVDMRSVSRVGQSDIGVNAKRIRSFLADLSGSDAA